MVRRWGAGRAGQERRAHNNADNAKMLMLMQMLMLMLMLILMLMLKYSVDGVWFGVVCTIERARGSFNTGAARGEAEGFHE